MKKIFAMLLIVALLCSGASAFAAGKLNVVTENFHVIESSWTETYTYAKIENVGDKMISVHSGILEIYDEAGDAINSADYLNAYAKYLEPGQYTYARINLSVEEGEATPTDYMLTIGGKSEKEYSNLRLPCEASLDLNAKDHWGNDVQYMYATVTNNTEEPLYDIQVVLALLDADGNILFITDDGMYSEKALMPGSSMIVRKEIYSNFKNYFAENSLTPASVDAIAYVTNR